MQTLCHDAILFNKKITIRLHRKYGIENYQVSHFTVYRKDAWNVSIIFKNNHSPDGFFFQASEKIKEHIKHLNSTIYYNAFIEQVKMQVQPPLVRVLDMEKVLKAVEKDIIEEYD